MKKFIAIFAVLAASSFANAQGISGHPDARNDRMPSAYAAEQRATPAYRRADHRRMKMGHHRHHRKHHHNM